MRSAIVTGSILLSACAGAPPKASAPPPGAPIPALGAAAAVPSGARWQLPSCPLRYEASSSESFETAGMPRSGQTLEAFLELDLRPKGDTAELHLRQTMWLRTGRLRPAAIPDDGFPPLQLRTDGRYVAPSEPAVLWSGLGTMGGLAWLFPDLAETNAEWRVPVDTRALHGNGISMLMSKAIAVVTPRPPLEIPVRVERTTSADGRVVVRGRGPITWSSRSPGGGANDPATLDRKGEVRTEHVILPTGRLLRASIRREEDLVLDVKEAKDGPMHSKYVQQTDVHLVGACDGPTEATLAPRLSREERAIQAVGELAMAIYGADPRAAAPAHFSPALRAKGDARLLDAIARYRKTRGDDAWPVPALVADDDVTARGDRIEIHVDAQAKSLTAKNTRESIPCRFAVVEAAGHMLVDALECRARSGAEALLLAHDRVAP